MKKILLLFTCILTAISAYAQLCQGSLGDPIVSINFGQGFNPGPPLNAAATGYIYTSGDCPNDGFYTVTNNSSNCFGSTWHNVSSDHTGHPNGYFMLVNASFQPSDFYVDTLRGLCGGSTYEFAAWIMNVILQNSCNSNTILPDLTFRVETTTGTVLKTYNTGSISPRSSPTWLQFGSFFTTPAGVSNVVLRIRNNAPGGCGNDLALDDISFRPCGPQMATTIDGQQSTFGELCEGSSKMFTLGANLSAGFNNPVYQWQQFVNNAWTDIPQATSSTLNVNINGNNGPRTIMYRLAVAESGNIGITQCRIYTASINIRVNPLPQTSVSNTGPSCSESPLTLNASGGVTYQWTGPQNFMANGSPVSIVASQGTAGKYYVNVSTSAGCTKIDSTTVVVYPSPVASTSFADSSLCAGDSIRLQGFPSPGSSFTWQPSTGLSDATINDPRASPSSDTKYLFIINDQNQCKDTAEVMIRVKQRPIVHAGPDKFLVEGQTVQLDGSVTGNYSSFSWSPPTDLSSTQVLRPVASPRSDMTYYLNVVGSCGTGSDSVDVKFYTGFYIPNIFSPNGDHLNDTWNIPALYAYPGFTLSVYNRFGQRVFYTRSAPGGWDGKYLGQPQSSGVYIYEINLPREPYHLKGSLILLR